MKLISGAEFALRGPGRGDGFDVDAGTHWVLCKEGVGFGLEASSHGLSCAGRAPTDFFRPGTLRSLWS